MADCVAKGRSRKGEDSPTSKLTESDVIEIRRCMSAGESYKDIGRRYGIHPMHCYNIASRTTWRHI